MHSLGDVGGEECKSLCVKRLKWKEWEGEVPPVFGFQEGKVKSTHRGAEGTEGPPNP